MGNPFEAPQFDLPVVESPPPVVYDRIRGWLILPLLGMVIAPAVTAILLSMASTAFKAGLWEDLTTPGGGFYDPSWAPFIIFEFVGRIALSILAVVGLYFAIQRDRRAPRLVIAYYLANVAFSAVQLVWVKWSLPIADQFTSSSLGDVLRGLLAAGVWVPYMLVSRRVKGTFVEIPSQSALHAGAESVVTVAPAPEPLAPAAEKLPEPTSLAPPRREQPLSPPASGLEWIYRGLVLAFLASITLPFFTIGDPVNAAMYWSILEGAIAIAALEMIGGLIGCFSLPSASNTSATALLSIVFLTVAMLLFILTWHWPGMPATFVAWPAIFTFLAAVFQNLFVQQVARFIGRKDLVRRAAYLLAFGQFVALGIAYAYFSREDLNKPLFSLLGIVAVVFVPLAYVMYANLIVALRVAVQKQAIADKQSAEASAR